MTKRSSRGGTAGEPPHRATPRAAEYGGAGEVPPLTRQPKSSRLLPSPHRSHNGAGRDGDRGSSRHLQRTLEEKNPDMLLGRTQAAPAPHRLTEDRPGRDRRNAAPLAPPAAGPGGEAAVSPPHLPQSCRGGGAGLTGTGRVTRRNPPPPAQRRRPRAPTTAPSPPPRRRGPRRRPEEAEPPPP